MGENRLVVAIVLFISGLLVFAYEIYSWFRRGSIAGITVLEVLHYFIPYRNWPWLWNPTDWLGVHKLLHTPLLVFFWVLAFLSVMSLPDDSREERKQEKEENPEH